MSNNIDIKDIYFGKSTAEKEGDSLHNYFISTRPYLNAKDHEKRRLLYVGNRGSGKSALFAQLSYELNIKQKNIVTKIMPFDFTYRAFKDMEHDFSDVRVAYVNAWYYTLLYHVFECVLKYFEEHKNINKNKENVKVINDFLVSSGFKKNDTKVKILIAIMKRLSSLKVKIKTKNIKLESDKPEYDEILDMFAGEDVKMPLKALSYITSTHPIHIFIDELDTGWDNAQESHNFINGLLRAAEKLNNMEGIYVYISLRKDMYNNLYIDDAEKMRGDIELLRWDKDNLKNLIGRRLIIQNPSIEGFLENISYDQALSLVFEDGVFEYIVKNTLHRPREIIELCNLAAQKYTDIYYTRFLYGKKIDLRIIDEVMETFSFDRFNDVCREYDKEYPGIRQLLEYFECCKVEMSHNEFLDQLEKSLVAFSYKCSKHQWVNEYMVNPIHLLEKLYDIGFIKISKGYGYYASYEKSQVQYHNVTSIKINNVFRSALQCHEE